MKIVVIANLRWIVVTPSWFRLAREGSTVHLIFNGKAWYLTDGVVSAQVPDRDTGAMMLAKTINELRAQGEGEGA